MILVVPFLNEEAYLDTFLASIERQTRPPDSLLLIDDGSSDRSPEIARSFADRHDYARALTRPPRAPGGDRLAAAAEFAAFLWGLDQIPPDAGVVAKLDADLDLTPDTLAEMERQLDADPQLGIAGAYLSIRAPNGELVRERCPVDHVRGATKFYRRRCLDDILPIPVSLGWDTIDEVKARMWGWKTTSFAVPDGDSIHLRPTSAHDGALRGMRRAGLGTWVYGAHPLWVLVSGLRRVHHYPFGIGTVAFFAAWLGAALRRTPRVDRQTRLFVQREQLARIRRELSLRGKG